MFFKKHHRAIAVLAVVVSISGVILKPIFISQSERKKIDSQNLKREKMGIPKIEEGWSTKNDVVWSAQGEAQTEKPFHKEKEVRDDFEIDRYVKVESDSVELMVELKYLFRVAPDSAWSSSFIKFINTKDDYKIESKNMSLMQVDSVLQKWNLSRTK
ncbi:MAG: hypothetical protein JSU09_15530 [Bacteroidetes bacterium]|nr:hypothetical protein [Bacteroidota bacterium]